MCMYLLDATRTEAFEISITPRPSDQNPALEVFPKQQNAAAYATALQGAALCGCAILRLVDGRASSRKLLERCPGQNIEGGLFGRISPLPL